MGVNNPNSSPSLSLDAQTYFGMKHRTIPSKCVNYDCATDVCETWNNFKYDIQVIK